MMTITTYNIKQSFLFTNENRLTLEAFNYILKNSETSTIDAVIIDNDIDNYKMTLRTGGTNIWDGKWNLIQIKQGTNTLYYTINSIHLAQDSTTEAWNLTCTIDLYYSYMVNLFSENNNNIETPIYYKQKHCNRFYYTNSNPSFVVNFSKQFYLLIKHPELENIKATKKLTLIPQSQWYNNTNIKIQNTAMLNSTYPGYLYALVKIGLDNFNVYNLNNPLQSILISLINLNNNPWVLEDTNNNAFVQQLNSLGDWDGSYTSVAWWWMTYYSGADVYEDYIVLPVSIEVGLIENSDGTYGPITSTIVEYIASLTTKNVAPTQDWKNLITYPVDPQHLYYFISLDTITSSLMNLFGNYFDNMGVEPYILNYYTYRVRACGEDSFVDLTAFDNCSSYAYNISLCSFVINFNHPVTQITNIPYPQLLSIYNKYNASGTLGGILIPWKYNQVSDPWWSINWKAIYPSASNNWANYLSNNLQQYHTALNIAHLAVQSSFANMMTNGIKTGTDIISNGLAASSSVMDLSNLFKNNKYDPLATGLSAYGDDVSSVGSLFSGIFSYLEQQQEYNYLRYGKAQDLSRIANLRLATNNNSISYNNFVISFILEVPLDSEINAIINYIQLNGYLIDRWLPFKFWLNRKYCNYFKCAYFSDMLLSGMIKPYRIAIDKIANSGFRIWTLAAINDGYIGDTINLFKFLINYNNGLNNTELNENNDEVNYMND